MKEGWTYKKLGEVFKTYAGGTPSKANKANYINGTIPWLRSGEVCKKYITESELYISEEGLRNSSAKYYPINTVLIAMYGATAAQCGILKFEATSNQAVCGVLPQKDFLPEFVYSYFVYIKDALAAQAQGGAQPNISQEIIKNVYFPCIPLSEQKLIVSRLDAAFSHIDELKVNAEKQLSEARALLQKSLAKAMEPKEGWEEKKLIEITHDNCPISYGIVQQGDHIDGGIPVVRPVDMREKYITRENLKCTTQTISDSYKRTILRGDELLLSVRGTTGIISLATPELKGCNVNRGIVPLYFKDQINKDFLYYEMVSPLLQSVFAEKTTGSTLKQINIKDLRLIKLSLPPLSEQQRIVERLDALSAHVRELEEYLKKIITECDALKQALLRKVFE
jgi:type I restriction enzyme S subunit